MKNPLLNLALTIPFLLLPKTAAAQTCAEPAGTQFQVDTLIAASTSNTLNTGETLNPVNAGSGAVQIAVAPDGRVFVAKMRSGEIRIYNPANPNTTTLAGVDTTFFSGEDGLLGIAIAPDFNTTRWLYALASDPCGINCANRSCVLVRYTVTNNLLTNKKVILRFPRRTNDNHHAAGGLAIDNNNVLVMGTGDNTDPHNSNNAGYGPIYFPTTNADAQSTASNTNDLRGKVLRIKLIAFADNQTPAPGVGSTYDIPPGNLWEKINNPAFNPGWDNTDSISKVRREIFTFGNRNPFHPRVDSRSGWIFWGDVGPDASSDGTRGPAGHDEWNLATSAGFYGHPYCNGYNVSYASLTSPSTTYGNRYDCLGTGSASLIPMVNSSPNNTGIRHMPPAVPALVAYTNGNSTDDDPRFNATYSTTTIQHSGEAAIGAPMYRYDSTAAVGRFPPFYEGKIFFFDWSRRSFRVIHISPNGTIPAGAAGVTNFAPNGFPLASYTDMQFGPDGMLYALRHSDNGYVSTNANGNGLYRIRYTGAYDNSCYRPFTPTIWGPGATENPTAIYRKASRKTLAPFATNRLLTLPLGYKAVDLYDVSGRKIWSYHRVQPDGLEQIRLPVELGQGIWQAKFLSE